MYSEQTPDGIKISLESNDELEILRTALAISANERLPLFPYPSGSRHRYVKLARRIDEVLYGRSEEQAAHTHTLSVKDSALCLEALKRRASEEPSLPRGATTGYGNLLSGTER